MKKIGLVFSLVLFLSVSFQAYAQWEWQYDFMPQFSILDFQFIDNQIGWAVGTANTILKTTDGGASWYQQTINNIYGSLHSVYFSNNQIGWVVGYAGTILKTTNGGLNWVLQNSETSSILNSVYFDDSQNGWVVVSLEGKILRTTNGGLNWISHNSGASDWLLSLNFADNQTGYAVGWGGEIVKTINGGLNWISQNSGTYRTLQSVYFNDNQTGWAVGDYGTIIKTSDGGQNWIAQNSGTTYRLLSVHFADIQTGWAVGEAGTILKTTNGGLSWYGQLRERSSTFRSVYFINNMTGWILGQGFILHTSNGGGVLLPVELTSFAANYSESSVRLSWSTATELNNNGFEVERSIDKDNWYTIGFVKGAGTTSEPQQYNFSDDLSDFSSVILFYRLKQLDFNGTYEYSSVIEVEMTPSKFALSQNYPNPFNPSTSIQYAISSTQFVTLKVYDLLGREVATLVNEEKAAGSYEIDFNVGRDSSPALASGIYFYKIQAGDFVETKKMLLLK